MVKNRMFRQVSISKFSSFAKGSLREKGSFPIFFGLDNSLFGMQLPYRNGVQSGADLYRYGFNNMEKDDELKGAGNSYDFGARLYDPRVGRWLGRDPLFAKYPALSPYNFGGNMPLNAIDPNGRDIIVLISPSGANGKGHTAALIGNATDGWYFYSKNGVGVHTSANSSGSSEPSVKPANGFLFKGLKSFANSKHNFQDAKQYYTEGYRLTSSGEIDEKMKEVCLAQVCSYYNLIEASCGDVPLDALKAGFFEGATYTQYLTRSGGELTLCELPTTENEYDAPILAYNQIKKNNPEGTVITESLVPSPDVKNAEKTLAKPPQVVLTHKEPEPITLSPSKVTGHEYTIYTQPSENTKPPMVIGTDIGIVLKAQKTLDQARPKQTPKKKG